MTDPLEQSLQRLPLRTPSAALDRRVLRAGRRRRVLWLATGAMAAALALVALLWAARQWPRTLLPNAPVASSRPTPAPAVAAAEPRRTERNWTQVTYQGRIDRADGPPLQAYRVRTWRDVQWQDDARGVTVRKTVPEERVMLVSAQMQ